MLVLSSRALMSDASQAAVGVIETGTDHGASGQCRTADTSLACLNTETAGLFPQREHGRMPGHRAMLASDVLAAVWALWSSKTIGICSLRVILLGGTRQFAVLRIISATRPTSTARASSTRTCVETRSTTADSRLSTKLYSQRRDVS